MSISSSSRKLDALRAEMRGAGVDGFIVPRVDIYQGEFVAPAAERLEWLTGFTGSAGTAVVLADKAVVMTDGRYTIQLAQQVDKSLFALADSTKEPASKWIAANAKQGAVIGYDPWLITPKQVETIEAVLKEKSIGLKPVANLIDNIWKNRPPAPQSKAEIFPESVAGASSAQKKAQVTKILQDAGTLATVINMPDSLAWLLNVRGGDIDSTPVILSLGILYADGRLKWFVDEAKITADVRRHVGNAVEILAPGGIEKQIDGLAAEAKKADKPVAVDFLRAPAAVKQRLETAGAKIVDLKDPCILPKSLKTPPEQDAIKKAHITDGIAMVKFLHWLETEAANGKLTEISVGDKLESIRAEDKSYKGASFPSIVGFADNGAIVHYRATQETSKPIKPDGLLLVDSGGQYNYGTTDITRTVAVGKPSEEMRRNFTLVLKGHIAVASAKFPDGTTGVQIDTLARAPLKAEGLDYAHGTGHGVGCFLSVHEEAANISPRGNDALQPGMLISNEPGYYKEGAYGIRIENLVLVKTLAGDTLGFETVTLAPIDRKLIIAAMLTADEKTWLNNYHAGVLKKLAPLLDAPLKAWLERQAQAL